MTCKAQSNLVLKDNPNDLHPLLVNFLAVMTQEELFLLLNPRFTAMLALAVMRKH